MLDEFFTIFLIDNIFCKPLQKIFTIIDNKTRWFLLHSIINFIIVRYSFNDFITCIIYDEICYKIKWNNESIITYNFAVMLHIYHCIFFSLTFDDCLHHFIMVLICGTLCYLNQNLLSSFSLFFLTGFPGGISYFILFLNKINLITKLTEKKLNLIISVIIRSPGCILTFYIGFKCFNDYYKNKNYLDLIIIIINLSLIFWNGQYYLLQTHNSYIKYLKT